MKIHSSVTEIYLADVRMGFGVNPTHLVISHL